VISVVAIPVLVAKGELGFLPDARMLVVVSSRRNRRCRRPRRSMRIIKRQAHLLLVKKGMRVMPRK